jgi:hypothetical protein
MDGAGTSSRELGWNRGGLLAGKDVLAEAPQAYVSLPHRFCWESSRGRYFRARWRESTMAWLSAGRKDAGAKLKVFPELRVT